MLNNRSDLQIVEQTEELARWLMSEMYQREAPNDTLFRNAEDLRSRQCWNLACKVQELLTDTDPENAVTEIDDMEIAPVTGRVQRLYATPKAATLWDVEMPEKPTDTMLEALRTGSRKDWPSDELCRVRYAALRAAVMAAQPGAQKEQNDA